MKSTKHKFFLIASLLLLPYISQQAAVDSLLALDVKCYFQKQFTTTLDRVVGQVAMTRLDTTQLLALLAKDSGISYTNGSRLKVVSGAVFVADANGKVLGNVSQYFQLKVNTNAELFNDARNLTNGEERTQSYRSMTFTINLKNSRLT